MPQPAARGDGAIVARGRTSGSSTTEGGAVVVADPRELPMGDDEREDRRQSWSTARVLDELRRRQARLEQLLEITHELARSQVREELLLQRVAERGAQVLAADALGVLLLVDDRFALRGAAGAAAEIFGESGLSLIHI